MTDLFTFVTTRFGVTLEALEALADRPVVHDGALSVVAAVAGHDALGVEAGAVRGAVAVGTASDADGHFNCLR